MRIQITRIFYGETDKDLSVDFVTSIGKGHGRWVGPLPKYLKEYDAEVELDQDLVWGNDIIKASEEKYAIAYEDGHLIIQGKIEAIDQDGVLNVRLTDSIFMLNAIGDYPFSPNTFVQIKAKQKILLYDANI